MTLRFCAVQFRGCGHIWEADRKLFETQSKGSQTSLLVCPECQKDCHFQLTEENIKYLADPSTIEKARQILEAYLHAKKPYLLPRP
jgi:CMP-N-acetylneuraminic acid synthetase